MYLLKSQFVITSLDDIIILANTYKEIGGEVLFKFEGDGK